MKVLFIVSGNKGRLSYVFQNQYESLKSHINDSRIYLVKGKGALGYLKNVIPLRKAYKEFKPDVVHAHYSFCGFLCLISGAFPAFVSLMGDDVNKRGVLKFLVKFCAKNFWGITIVKSQDMFDKLDLAHVHVISNGVSVRRFRPMNKLECCKTLNWDTSKIHLLFGSKPTRPEKNYELFEKSLIPVNPLFPDIKIHALTDIKPKDVPLYLNASDVVILSSIREGSPNVIKEAMACNRPIVSTDVGDVSKVIGDTEGCYIANFDPSHFSEQLKKAIEFSLQQEATNGRERILNLNLDADSVTRQILELYRNKGLR